jgi:hypothetical protein
MNKAIVGNFPHPNLQTRFEVLNHDGRRKDGTWVNPKSPLHARIFRMPKWVTQEDNKYHVI